MSNKTIINKLISGILINTMVLGISNQVFENFKIFASSGNQEERILGESEKRIQGDEDYYNAEELDENNIDKNELKYELDGEEAKVVGFVGSEMKVVTIPSHIKKKGKSHIKKKGKGHIKKNGRGHIKKDGKVYKVTRIGASAFSDCSGLTKIIVPKGVEIDTCAFPSGVEIEEYKMQ